MNDPQPNNNQVLQQNETPKQPYEKPAVIYRAPLEATAGQCTESPGKTGIGCTVIQS
ncbi:MAG: hypothetical protein N2559_15135 [Anaerolineae bacterium]|nr:hypothetical protein [Anaerolineae bacterium]